MNDLFKEQISRALNPETPDKFAKLIERLKKLSSFELPEKYKVFKLDNPPIYYLRTSECIDGITEITEFTIKANSLSASIIYLPKEHKIKSILTNLRKHPILELNIEEAYNKLESELRTLESYANLIEQ